MRTVTKSVELSCPPRVAWRFLADGGNWPVWAVHNALETSPDGPGAWRMRTPRGCGRLEIGGSPETGILDHAFIDPREGRWEVPARVGPVAGGSVFMMTLTRPPALPDDAFAAGLRALDDELATLAGRTT